MPSNEIRHLQAALRDARDALPAVVVGSLLLGKYWLTVPKQLRSLPLTYPYHAGVFTLLLGFSAYIHR